MIRIGICACCQNRRRLDENEACPECVDRFGKSAGIIAKRLREDPKFHMEVYKRFRQEKPYAVDVFIKMFGKPEIEVV